MKPFLDDNFLLQNVTGAQLYTRFAKDMPIIDYHCHLSPQEIYENKRFANLTEAWLYGDHYKWRLMRAAGFDESYITGGASDYDRFAAWVKTLPMAIGNPVYHWSHMELQRYFGVRELINEQNAELIWNKVNAKLQDGGFGARDLIAKFNVKVVCTTDDPTDSLEYHLKIRELDDFETAVLPSFRPDKGIEINRSTFVPWVHKLSQVTGQKIESYREMLEALEKRAQFFHSVGGRLSDHGLDYVPYAQTTEEEASAIFKKALDGQAVTAEEETKYKTYTLLFLGRLYEKLGWVMQFHMNATRNNNSAMFAQLGPDTGFDAMSDAPVSYALTRIFDDLQKEDALPKTIVYSLNPNDIEVLAALLGSFQGGTAGKMQLGSAWWFNDTKDGMLQQMKTLANYGLLGKFVGMLTDSRSFLSYPRHDYFRRILCNLIGEWVEQGEFPYDEQLLEQIVKGICFHNAKEYFAF